MRVVRDTNIFVVVVVDLVEGSCWYDDDFEEDASVLICCPFPHYRLSVAQSIIQHPTTSSILTNPLRNQPGQTHAPISRSISNFSIITLEEGTPPDLIVHAAPTGNGVLRSTK